jgi:peptidoglycan/LPS O-acetylase OafA/YrhL
MIVFGSLYLDALVRRGITVRALTFLGHASYSIYLTHQLSYRAFEKLPLFARLPADAAIILATLAAIIMGSFAYLIVETPINRLCRRVIQGRVRATRASDPQWERRLNDNTFCRIFVQPSLTRILDRQNLAKQNSKAQVQSSMYRKPNLLS